MKKNPKFYTEEEQKLRMQCLQMVHSRYGSTLWASTPPPLKKVKEDAEELFNFIKGN